MIGLKHNLSRQISKKTFEHIISQLNGIQQYHGVDLSKLLFS